MFKQIIKKLCLLVIIGANLKIDAMTLGISTPINKSVTIFSSMSEEKPNLMRLRTINFDCGEIGLYFKNCIVLTGEIAPNPYGDDPLFESFTEYGRFKEKLEELFLEFLPFYLQRKLMYSTGLNSNKPSIEPISIFLNSSGGDVDEAMKIGRLIRKYNINTKIAAGDFCLSSCFLVYMSGVRRDLGFEVYIDTTLKQPYSTSYELSPLGIHRPYFDREKFADLPSNVASKMYKAKQDDVESFLSEMGAENFFIQKMKNTPSDEMFTLTLDIYDKAVANNQISSRFFEWDPVHYDRYIGSNLEMDEFQIIEQIDSIFPDFVDRLPPFVLKIRDLLIKLYGEEFWKKDWDDFSDGTELSKDECLEIVRLYEVLPKPCGEFISRDEYLGLIYDIYDSKK